MRVLEPPRAPLRMGHGIRLTVQIPQAGLMLTSRFWRHVGMRARESFLRILLYRWTRFLWPSASLWPSSILATISSSATLQHHVASRRVQATPFARTLLVVRPFLLLIVSPPLRELNFSAIPVSHFCVCKSFLRSRLVRPRTPAFLQGLWSIRPLAFNDAHCEQRMRWDYAHR